MKLQRRQDTAPERALRSELWRRGLRYRANVIVVGKRRTVDIAFIGSKVAVFVDGCFWHGCPQHGSLPKSNAMWWRSKLEANTARDLETNLQLASEGWEVMRVWEHEDPVRAADRVERLVRSRGSGRRLGVDV